jgi:glycosyltransferase involved in cell wall biosynthesis
MDLLSFVPMHGGGMDDYCMISILLAAYNGEKYIAEQIESLLSQTYQDFKLYINDDKSTDSTYAIITKYAQEFPNKIIASQNEENAGSAKHNFLQMMIEHKNDYVMLCDQDDIWLPDKILKSFARIKDMEKEYGAAAPILVYTNLTVVKDNLEVIEYSYEKMSNKSFDKSSLNFAVAMNNVAGCTAMYNRALSDLILPVQAQACAKAEYIVMHDWWLYLIAAAFGKISAIHYPTILHRQHKENESGAKRVLSPKYIYYVLTHLKKMSSMIDDSYKQCGAFLNMYEDKLTKENAELIGAYASLGELARIRRLKTIRKYKTYMHGFARRIAQIMFLIISGKWKVES